MRLPVPLEQGCCSVGACQNVALDEREDGLSVVDAKLSRAPAGGSQCISRRDDA